MEKELYLFVAASIGALAAYVTAKITSGTQLAIAKLSAEKDITLQRDRLQDERVKDALSIERNKLDILHRTLSRISLENSQTMSYMQSDSNLSITDFRVRYLDNCDHLHEAMAIVDIYYPKMSDSLKKIYGQSNIFWGTQENLLRTDIKANPSGWKSILSEVLKAGESIQTLTRQLKEEVAYRAKELTANLEERR